MNIDILQLSTVICYILFLLAMNQLPNLIKMYCVDLLKGYLIQTNEWIKKEER